jgi:hypothetical protein
LAFLFFNVLKQKLNRVEKKLYDDFQLDNRVKNLSEMTIRFYEQKWNLMLNIFEEVIQLMGSLAEEGGLKERILNI